MLFHESGEDVMKKHFSMIRSFHISDLFTLSNAFCGMGAVFAVMHHLQVNRNGYLLLAALFVVMAVIFDVFDGRIARWRSVHSEMGKELDSLADIISFGVAPAAMAYGCGMQGIWDQLILMYFVGCGVSRLARYNITAEALSQGAAKVKYFEGTPIPTSIVLVVVLVIAVITGNIGQDLFWGVWKIGPWYLHPLVLLFGISGSLMISQTIHIPKP